MTNVLTVDLEDWYQTNDFNISNDKWYSYEDRIVDSTERLIELFDINGVKATFFVLGYIAKKHPRLIKRIIQEGHEVASHGNVHKMVTKESREWFKQDLIESKNILEDITGQAIKYHRAASWSISRETLWMLEILEEEGFICDSSLQPFCTPLSGFDRAPVVPFKPIINGKKLNIVEFPSTVFKLGLLRVPFSGGFYLRFWPSWVVTQLLKFVNKKNPGMVYLHPWEIDIKQPRLDVPPHIKFVHYYNLSSTLSKADHLLKNFNFVHLGKILNNREFPAIEI